MNLLVKINTPHAVGIVGVSAPTLSEAFAKIPTVAADMGLGLANDGVPVGYTVRVLAS